MTCAEGPKLNRGEKKCRKALLKLGMKKFGTVNIIGFNSPEWFMSSLGAILAGGVATGIYTSNNAEACYYVADHSEAEIVVCEGKEQLTKFQSIQSRLPKLKAFVVYNDNGEVHTMRDESVPVYIWDDFIPLGTDVEDGELEMAVTTDCGGP